MVFVDEEFMLAWLIRYLRSGRPVIGLRPARLTMLLVPGIRPAAARRAAVFWSFANPAPVGSMLFKKLLALVLALELLEPAPLGSLCRDASKFAVFGSIRRLAVFGSCRLAANKAIFGSVRELRLGRPELELELRPFDLPSV